MKRILIVDDDRGDRRLLSSIIMNSWPDTFDVIEVDSGQRALDEIARQVPDLILLDIYMEGIDGFGVLKELRLKDMGYVPVILVSSFIGEQDKTHGLELGAMDFINKPIVAEDVMARISVQLKIKKVIEDNEWASNKSNQSIRLLYKELEQKSAEKDALLMQLDELTLTDPMTGAINRRGLQRALTREVAWVSRYGTNLLAVLLDLDNFKEINDTYGYSMGDMILKEVAKNLKNSLRSVDYIARIGGDEFIVLFAQMHLGDGFGVAEKIRFVISQTECTLNDIPVRATASLGLAQVTEDCATVDELVRKCQFALKRSKVLGKNRTTANEPNPNFNENFLRDVLEAMNKPDTYRVVKQPIFHLADRRPIGYEFLTRLNVPMFEMPDDFFRLCRANNMLTIVDRQCLHCCVTAGQQVERGLRKHLNIFPTTAVEIPVEEILREFPPEMRGEFCLELSEELIFSDLSKLIKPIKILQEAGILIAIDDVGFGRSCLESLVIFEPDIVKIDKKVNIGLANDKGRQRSLERLLRIVHSLKAQVVVEGIETEEDLRVLLDMGVEYGQGYLLGRPA